MADSREEFFSKDLHELMVEITVFNSKVGKSVIANVDTLIPLFNFLTTRKEYQQLADSIFSIFLDKGITGEKLRDDCAEATGLNKLEQNDYSEHQKPEFFEDLKRILTLLAEVAQNDGRVAVVEDFIRQLFSYKYNVKNSLTDFLAKYYGNTATSKICYDIKKLLKFKQVNTQKLASLPYIALVNDLVLRNPDDHEYFELDEYIEKLYVVLSSKINKNPIIVGKAGIGKTSLVYELAKRINNNEVPGFLANKKIYQLYPDLIIAGTRYRGDTEERVTELMETLKDASDVILFIDEFHNIIDLGGTSDGSVTAGEIMKKYLSDGSVQIIGATTDDEFIKVKKNKAIERRVERINIGEPSNETTKKILEHLLPSYEKHFDLKVEDGLVDAIIQKANRYDPSIANPAKSLKMLDASMSYARLNKKTIAKEEDLDIALTNKYNITLSKTPTKDTVAALNSVILGQENALVKISKLLLPIELGIYDRTKPTLSMLLAGPTGVGKTESAIQIAKYWFGSDKKILKLNMGEFTTDMDVTKLTGSAPGYVGHDSESVIVKFMEQNPNSVILFDEVEKASPKIWDVLLGILDKGEMTDNHGREISFKNTIIIFTTNLGYASDSNNAKKSLGIIKSAPTNEEIAENAMEEIKKYFKPEFINRLDDIIIYNKLDLKVARELTDRYKVEFEKLSGLKFEFSEKNYENIYNSAQIDIYGARGLKRAVKTEIVELVSKERGENINGI